MEAEWDYQRDPKYSRSHNAKSGLLRIPLFSFPARPKASFRSHRKLKKTPQGGAFCIYPRREWDSNPRYPFGVYTLSRRAPSTTRTSLHYLGRGTKIRKISKRAMKPISKLKSSLAKLHRADHNGHRNDQCVEQDSRKHEKRK